MKRIFSLVCVMILLMSVVAVQSNAVAASRLRPYSTSGSYVSADNNLMLKWNGISGASKYRVYAKDNTLNSVLVNNVVKTKYYTINNSLLGYARTISITVTALSQWNKTLASETITIKTKAGRGSCTTLSASVNQSKVTFEFRVDTNGGLNITDCGIVFGTSASNLNRRLSYGAVGARKGKFKLRSTFNSGVYYYRAFVTNGCGRAYGALKKVTVYHCPFCKGRAFVGSYSQVYAHTMRTGDFKNNRSLKRLWETGSKLLTSGIESYIN